MNAQNSRNEKYEKESTAQGESASIKELFARLNDLIGLSDVMTELNAEILHKTLCQEMGLVAADGFFFTGNPGTGKTTVARLMAQMYKVFGFLQQGQTVEIFSSELIAGYVGQTALKTREMVDKALGGVLFVDEAHALISHPFGQEAIDELLKCMEDHPNDLIVILAGDTDQMTQLIESNPGLASRFHKPIEFEDYTGNELMQIFEINCKKNSYELTPTARVMLQKHFDTLYKNRDKNFGNGRTVRNIFQQLVETQAQRLNNLMLSKDAEHSLTNEELLTITAQDVMDCLKIIHTLE